MKKVGIQTLVSGLLVLISIFLVTGCFEGAYSTVNVSGTLVAKEKDSAGNATSVEIKTDTGQSVLVNNTGKGKELGRMVDKKVEVTGTVLEDKGVKQITVVSYKVVQ